MRLSSERSAPDVEGYWEHGSIFPNFLYRCADGRLVQVWFGGKGMYPALLEALVDPHLAEVVLARRRTDGVHDDVVVGAAVTVGP